MVSVFSVLGGIGIGWRNGEGMVGVSGFAAVLGGFTSRSPSSTAIASMNTSISGLHDSEFSIPDSLSSLRLCSALIGLGCLVF